MNILPVVNTRFCSFAGAIILLLLTFVLPEQGVAELVDF